jgi:hypothetical protein
MIAATARRDALLNHNLYLSFNFFSIPTDETIQKYCSRLFQGSNNKATKLLEGHQEEQEMSEDEEEPSTGRRQIPKELVSEIERLLRED